MSKVNIIERPAHTDLSVYESGRLRLHKNENTDPGFNRIIQSIIDRTSADAASIYPDMFQLYRRLSDFLSIAPDQLLISAGSDGAIRFLYEYFNSDKATVLFPNPTFAMYDVYAKIYNYRVINVEYKRDHHQPFLPMGELVTALIQHKPTLFFLANPDSPTGTVLSQRDLTLLLDTAVETNTFVVIDEAYYPIYSTSAQSMLSVYSNLAILRTFSKAWALAGARVGYMIGNADFIGKISCMRPMYEIGNMSLLLAQAVLDYESEMLESVEKLNEGKLFFKTAMQELGFITTVSHGNFQHVNFGKYAEAIHAKLAPTVLYRHDIEHPCLSGFSRFSSTTKENFEKVIKLIKDVVS